MATQDRVRVYARTRPSLPSESKSCLGMTRGDAPGASTVILRQPQREARTFYFDGVFDDRSTQKEVYDEVAKPVLTDVLKVRCRPPPAVFASV